MMQILIPLFILAISLFLIILLIRLWQACDTIDELDRRTEQMNKNNRELRDDLRHLREEIRSYAASNPEQKEETRR